MESETIWIVSFDIGKANFAFYIEEVNINELKKIENIVKESRYNQNGSLTNEMNNLLNKVYCTGKTIIYVNEDLTKDTNKKKYLDTDIYYNMNDHLDKYLSYFDKCSYFIIELQLKRNTMAMKLGQHCYSYFTIKYGEKLRSGNNKCKYIVEFPSFYKTQILGAEKIFDKKYKNGNIKWKTMDQRMRKKWAVTKGKEILKIREEDNILEDISKLPRGKRKLDDIFDTKLMIEAFKYMYFVDDVKF
jgi:hypothetical protein